MKAADVDRVLTINAAAAAVDGVSALDEATTRALRDHPTSFWAHVEDDGFVIVKAGEMTFAVAPPARGGGLGDRLARLGVENGAERMWLHAPSPSGYALAGRNGMRPNRELRVMRRSISDSDAAAAADGVSVPDGLTLRSFQPGDEAEIVRVNHAAFAWHPEQALMDAADLASRMAEDWFDPEGLLTLWDGATLLGFHWTKRHADSALGRTSGEIYVIGIDPTAQGRGLGRLLTLAGLDHMAGLDEVHLYVESDNTAAIKLYESLGFTHSPRDTHVQFAIPYVEALD